METFPNLDILHWLLISLLFIAMLVIRWLYLKLPEDLRSKISQFFVITIPAITIVPVVNFIGNIKIPKIPKPKLPDINWNWIITVLSSMTLIYMLAIHGKRIKAVWDLKDFEFSLEIESDTIHIQEYPHDLVKNDGEGKYFLVELKDAVSKETLKFKAGEYTIREYDK
jgi:hypothetical protein